MIKPVFQMYTWKTDLENCGPEKHLLSTKISIFTHENKVSLTSSSQYTGTNQKSGKRWFRWETGGAMGFRRNDLGTIIPFSVSKQGSKFRPGYYDPFDPATAARSQYLNQVKTVFNVTRPADVYPMLDVYGFDRWRDIPYGMAKYFRLSNEKDFTRALFGKSNYRRDLLKAVCQSSPSKLLVAKQFNGLVPVDWIIGWLNNSDSIFPANFRVDNLRKALLELDPRSYRRLLQDYDNYAGQFIADINRYTADTGALYVRSFNDWHDQIWAGDRVIHRKQNEPIKQSSLAQKLHMYTENDLKFVTAQETDDMYKWSELMSNCISGYSYDALLGNGIYGAVERNNKVIANYEIKSGALKQLLGRFNQSLSEPLRKQAVDMLTANGVDCSGQWWGRN